MCSSCIILTFYIWYIFYLLESQNTADSTATAQESTTDDTKYTTEETEHTTSGTGYTTGGTDYTTGGTDYTTGETDYTAGGTDYTTDGTDYTTADVTETTTGTDYTTSVPVTEQTTLLMTSSAAPVLCLYFALHLLLIKSEAFVLKPLHFIIIMWIIAVDTMDYVWVCGSKTVKDFTVTLLVVTVFDLELYICRLCWP